MPIETYVQKKTQEIYLRNKRRKSSPFVHEIIFIVISINDVGTLIVILNGYTQI